MATYSDNITGIIELLEAAREGCTQKLDELISQREIDINVSDNEGMTALMLASMNGHINCVCSLIKDGRTSVNQQDGNGKTSLMLAAEKGQVNCVNWLLSIPKVDPRIQDKDGMTALILSAVNGHDKCIETLIGKVDLNMCDIHGRSAFMYAALNSHFKCVELLGNTKNCAMESSDQEVTQDAMLIEGHVNVLGRCLSLVDCNPTVNLDDSDNEGNTALMMAASNGHKDCIEFLMDKAQVDINRVNSKRKTALMLASANNHSSCVECLIKATDIGINMQDERGRTALMHATKNGHNACVSKLLKGRGINVNSRDYKSKTCLMLSAKYGKLDCLKLIIESREVDFAMRDENGQTALMLAARNGCIDCFKHLIQACPRREGEQDINLQEETGNTALTLALQNPNNKDILEALIGTEDIKLDLQDKHGVTALMLATNNGNKKFVQDLIKTKKVDVNKKKGNGLTALMIAILFNKFECFESLLSVKEQEFNIQDNDWCTALMLAAEHGFAKYVEYLTHVPGIKVNMQNRDGNTALAMAAKNGHAKCVQTLLHVNDIDINKQNMEGHTAFMLCAMNNQTECMELLLNTSGLSVNHLDHKGNTALMLSSRNGHSDCVKLLLSKKDVDPKICNNSGRNFLMLACLKGHCKVLKCFLDIKSKGQVSSDAWGSKYSQHGVTSAPIFIRKHPGTYFHYYSDITWDRPYIYSRCQQETRTLINIELGTDPSNSFNCVSCFLLGKVDGSVAEICACSDIPISDNKLCIFDHTGNTDLMFCAGKGFVECLEYLLQIHRVRFHTLVLLFKNELYENGIISLILYRKLCCLIRDYDQIDYFLSMIYKGDHPGPCIDFLLSAYLCQCNKFQKSAISLAVSQEHYDCLRLLVEHVHNRHKLNKHMKYVFLDAAQNHEKLNHTPIFLKAGIFDWSWYPEFPPKKQRYVARELIINGYAPGVFEYNGRPSSPLKHAFMIYDSGLVQYLVANLYMTSSDLVMFLKGSKGSHELSSQPWRLEALSILAINSFLKSKMRERDMSLISSYELKDDLEIRLSFMNPIRWLCVKQWRVVLDTGFPLHGGKVALNEKDFTPGKCCNGACKQMRRNKYQ